MIYLRLTQRGGWAMILKLPPEFMISFEFRQLAHPHNQSRDRWSSAEVQVQEKSPPAFCVAGSPHNSPGASANLRLEKQI